MKYEMKYLELLSNDFPTVQAVSTELINLTAILNLPKGTEVFITDIHGEFDAFNHVLKNACGIIQDKIEKLFPLLSYTEKNRLAFFIYYPTDMLNKYQSLLSLAKMTSLLKDILSHMLELSRNLATKYTKSKIQKTLPEEFAYIIQELLYESNKHEDKERYYNAIIDAIFSTNRQNKFIVQISKLIRALAIDRLHIVGDIFDRGAKPHLVMEKLLDKSHVDIQWGNHDISWIGAACGSELMIANVIRIAARYNNLDCLEDGYGFNLLPLARFASKTYGSDPCELFIPKTLHDNLNEDDKNFVAKIHKAAAVMQFKLERDVVKRNPDFHLDDRLLLDKIDPIRGIVTIQGIEYPMKDTHFPTIDFENDPYQLTEDEQAVLAHLRQLFLHNEMMQLHLRFLFQKGSMVLKYNNNLLFHAAIPLQIDGSFQSQMIDGVKYHGKALFEAYEKKLRHAYQNRYDRHNPDLDYFMMLWQGSTSPLFGKSTMKTFERYFVSDKTTHKEVMNPYFKLRLEEPILKQIYQEFGLNWNKSKIINGHVPMDITRGHEVVLADKRIYNIDGGMSKEYSHETSIGGYTLISDSYAIYLVSHERFDSYESLIKQERDIVSLTRSEDIASSRTYIYDTDRGEELKERIADLRKLLLSYRNGTIKEKA
ncbi:MAG: fructose-1,6-bisphosphatase [bacterium]|nr:fructose-1,6-bisphosphatase [bacterium]